MEGESLQDRLERERQLPVEDALAIARGVATALHHAHSHGVIHRDIKPANILLQGGEPVVADFGIALAVSTAGGGRLTETGLSLGTPHYMSPEQASGDRSVDGRTDVYALGCVLYQMLVGEPPHVGPTPQSVLAKILTDTPKAPRAVRSSIPANVDAAVRKALEKLPADRFGTAQEFAKALSDSAFRHGEDRRTTPAFGRSGWKRSAVAAVAILAVGLSAGRGLARPESRVARWTFLLPGSHRIGGAGGGVNVTLSPDGRRVVYVSESPEVRVQLWQRTLDQLEPAPIPGTTGAGHPSISPDGTMVAFVEAQSLKTLPLAGGPAFTVVPAGVNDGLDWASDGNIYFSTVDGALSRVAASGGEPELLTTPANGTDHRWVEVLPGGRGMLFTIVQFGQGPDRSRIAAAGVDGGEFAVLLDGAMARYAASGHLLYTVADGTLMAAPFDARRLRVTGAAVPLVQDVRTASGSASAFAVAESGMLAYATGSPLQRRPSYASRAGALEEIEPGWAAQLFDFALSPDGNRLAFTMTGNEGAGDIWVKQLDRAGSPLSRLTYDGADFRPSWTPDGRAITYISDGRDTTRLDVWVVRADGTGAPRRLVHFDRKIREAAWSPDGKWLLTRTGSVPGELDIFVIRPGVDSVPQPLVATPADESSPSISPDGRWLVHVSNETGRNEVYVRPFPNADEGKWQISTSGGREPIWAHSGRELFYWNEAELMRVEVSGTTTFNVGETTSLFTDTNFLGGANHPAYAITPDDQRFVMPRQGEATSITVVEDFLSELKRRLGR